MKFYGTLSVYRYEDNWNPETIEIFKDYFEAKSIQAAKAHLTRIANGQTLFSWVQSWDNETREYTGKDLRWKPWVNPGNYKQDNGTEVAWSTRMSERESGETVYPDGYGKYGKSVEYRVDIAVHWRFKKIDD